MRIGGTTRDSMMALIPIGVAVIVVMFLLGGPEDGLRALERMVGDAWSFVVVLIRR